MDGLSDKELGQILLALREDGIVRYPEAKRILEEVKRARRQHGGSALEILDAILGREVERGEG